MKRIFRLAMAAIALGASLPAAAQTYPNRPVVIVVPFAAGGPTDIVARVIGESLSTTLGQQFVIENAAGAAGTTGAARVARATPDGYTLLMGPMSTMSFSPSLYPNAGFDPLKDLEPVGIVASAPIMLVASKALPVSNFAEFTQLARSKGAEMVNGNAGVGSTSHLACLLLNREIKASATMVPYRGTGPAIQDLVGGQVHYICDQVTSLMGQVQSGAVTPLAMLAPARSPVLPNVPTAAEVGVPGVEMVVWNALFAPKGTPPDVVARINAAISKGLDTPAAEQRFRTLGAEAPAAAMRTSEALARIHAADVAKWGGLIRTSDIKVSP
jgi:tripartite-type tricarboxylate transporter receptor subunit TctC